MPLSETRRDSRKERVRFKFGRNHRMGSKETRLEFSDVLKAAFDMRCSEVSDLLNTLSLTDYWIICRPSQFARFIIYRNQKETLKNWVKELEPEIIPPPRTVYQKIVEETGHDAGTVNTILSRAGVRNKVIPEDDLVYDLDVTRRHGRASDDEGDDVPEVRRAC